MQESIDLSAADRAIIETGFEATHVDGIDAETEGDGTGSGAARLVDWVDAVVALMRNRDNAEATARALGRASLEKGLTRAGWRASSIWMDALGLGRSFAMGCWMEGGACEPLVTVPAALAPVATMLDL